MYVCVCDMHGSLSAYICIYARAPLQHVQSKVI